MPSDLTGVSAAPGAPRAGGPRAPGAPARLRRIARRVAIGALVTVAVLVVAAVALYALGGPQGVPAADVAAYEAGVPAAMQVPRRAVLPIPGCVCHSDDPAVRAEHSRYRLRECGSCHGR